jgi:hypothetical protein
MTVACENVPPSFPLSPPPPKLTGYADYSLGGVAGLWEPNPQWPGRMAIYHIYTSEREFRLVYSIGSGLTAPRVS